MEKSSTKEEAAGILATLTNGCLETQNAAFGAGAIKKALAASQRILWPIPSIASGRVS